MATFRSSLGFLGFSFKDLLEMLALHFEEADQPGTTSSCVLRD